MQKRFRYSQGSMKQRAGHAGKTAGDRESSEPFAVFNRASNRWCFPVGRGGGRLRWDVTPFPSSVLVAELMHPFGWITVPRDCSSARRCCEIGSPSKAGNAPRHQVSPKLLKVGTNTTGSRRSRDFISSLEHRSSAWFCSLLPALQDLGLRLTYHVSPDFPVTFSLAL